MGIVDAQKQSQPVEDALPVRENQNRKAKAGGEKRSVVKKFTGKSVYEIRCKQGLEKQKPLSTLEGRVMQRAALEKPIRDRRKKEASRIFGKNAARVKKTNYRKKHPLDCGNTRCQLCHSDKYPKRTPTRQERIEGERMKLTDDFIQDEPLAYLVKCFDTTMHEYKVFVSEHEADSFAAIQEDEAGSNGELEDWLVYPLYAASPLRPSTGAYKP